MVELELMWVEEVVEDEDEDEWSAALRFSKRATEEEVMEMELMMVDESDVYVYDEVMCVNVVVCVLEIVDIWVEDLMDDIVVVLSSF